MTVKSDEVILRLKIIYLLVIKEEMEISFIDLYVCHNFYIVITVIM